MMFSASKFCDVRVLFFIIIIFFFLVFPPVLMSVVLVVPEEAQGFLCMYEWMMM